jgi:succinate-acetate transporter protein
VAFFLLFFTLDMAFLLLGIAYLHRPSDAGPNTAILKAGGFFALLAAFLAWYNALAGIADTSNSFFIIPVAHFPWSELGRERRSKTAREMA